MSNNRCEHMPIVPGVHMKPNGSDRVLYFKSVMTTRDEAVRAIQNRELDPGQLAVARYYIGYSDQTIPPTWTGIRMIMGVGGTGFSIDDKLYIFDDSNFNFVIKNAADENINLSLEDAVQYLLNNINGNSNNPSTPNNTLTEEQIRKIIVSEISSSLSSVNNRIDGIDRRVSEIDSRITTNQENFSRDIDEIRSKIENIDINIDLSQYATIQYVNERIAAINIPDIADIKDDIRMINSNINEINDEIKNIKTDISTNASAIVGLKEDIKSLEEATGNIFDVIDASISANAELIANLSVKVDTKVDALFVDNHFNENIKSVNDNIASLSANITDVKNSVNEIKSDITNIQADLSSKVDASFVENHFNENIKEMNSAINVLADDIATINDNISNKVDADFVNSAIENSVNNIVANFDEKLAEKVDASYVEKYFDDNVKSTVDEIIIEANIPGIVESEIDKQNISEQVSSAVDKKLEDFEGITTENLEETLQENEYFTTVVLQPIENISDKLVVIEKQLQDVEADFDGAEEPIWYITTANSEDDLKEAIVNSENVEIEGDIELASTLVVPAVANMAINVNTFNLTKNGTGATIRVNGGTLIIDGSTGVINGNNGGEEIGDNSAVRCSDNGHIIINGGHFTCGDDGKDGGNSCIYCTEGLIEIYGGTFEQTHSKVGRLYTLNCQDTNFKLGKAKIVVYGGTFLNGYDPADSKSENPAGNFVADGYKSIYDEETNSYSVVKIK